ncbi:HlyD family secretion protein [Pseudoalteromonas aurantia]|nr:HlyD family efflux transporter periplasmic adaptor subunit [Pseudoalteromonas aurantia]
MQGKLFRSQALEHQKDRLHGQALVVPRFSYTIISVLLFIWVVAVSFWLFNSQFAKKETALGWVEPSAGIIRVFPDASSGTVKEVLVKAGEWVIKNQPLAIISGDKMLMNGAHLEDVLLNEYQEQQKIIKQQLARTRLIFKLKREDAKLQLSASKQDLDRLNNQIKTLSERFELSKSKAANYSKMVTQGFVSEVDGQSIEEQKLALKSQFESLEREKVNQKNRIEQLNTQLALLPSEEENQIDELNRNLSDIAQRTAQLQGQKEYIVRAAVDGFVSNLQVKNGQQTQQNFPLMFLVPPNDGMEVKLLVPVRAAGFVKPGQEIEIRYDAFPYQKFGLYSGQLAHISESILLPSELDSAPVPSSEAVYLVTAKLNSPTVNAYGQEFSLKVGMTLSADIKLTDRTILEWLLEPLLSIKGKL